MFLRSWRGVVLAVTLFALFGYLMITNRYEAAEPWVDATLFVVIAYLFMRSWLG